MKEFGAKEFGEFERLVAEFEAKEALAQRIVATLVALGALASRFVLRRDEWCFMAEKARRWLEAQNVSAPWGFESLEAWTEYVLGVSITRPGPDGRRT